MKNIYSNIYKPTLHNLRKAKKNIENNNLIGLPTETVYGLAGNAYSNTSIKKIYKMKKRPSINPLIIHFRNINLLKENTIFNKNFLKLHRALCPGPITFILNKSSQSKISKKATAYKKTVAIRFPEHPVARKLLKILNVPLAAPSANMSSRLSPTCANDVFDEFGNKIKLILDGGRSKIGVESTIVDLTGKPKILRAGFITAEKIYKILGKKIFVEKKTKTIKSPGQLNLHYSPGIPVYVNKINPKKDGAFISFGKKFKNDTNYFNLSKKSDLKEAANNLYKTMRIIKKLKFKSISVCRIPKLGLGLAINDRLKKAANK